MEGRKHIEGARMHLNRLVCFCYGKSTFEVYSLVAGIITV